MKKIFTILLIMMISFPVYAERVTDQLKTFYTFKTGNGAEIVDHIGNLDMNIYDPTNMDWIVGGGIIIHSPTRIESKISANQLVADIQSTGELTIEIWAMSLSNVQTGPARMLSLSMNGYPDGGNFMMGQDGLGMEIRVRSTTTDGYGFPALTVTNILDFSNIQHIVYTKSLNGQTNLYVDGVFIANSTNSGDFSNWANYTLTIAGESNSPDSRFWLGTIHLIAIYSKALSSVEVEQNYDAGYDDEYIPPEYNPEVDATVQWTAPVGGTPVVSYRVEHSINSEPWYSYGLSELNRIHVRMSFFDYHRFRVAGIDSNNILGGFSEPSDIHLPSDYVPNIPGKPERITE